MGESCANERNSMKIFVSNLSFLLTEDDLDLIFKPFGEVGEIIISHEKQTDLPVALIEMKSIDEVRAAIKVLNGIEIIGQTINLRFRNSDIHRRGDTNRRLGETRRVTPIRRSTRNRRMNVATIDSEDKRANNDRRASYERRQISPRRITENRRVLSVRRALA